MKSSNLMETARRVMYECLKQNRVIDVVFKTKNEALSFRHTMYHSRKNERKAAAKIQELPEHMIDHELDAISAKIIEQSGEFICRVFTQDCLKFEIRDAETGESLTKESLHDRQPSDPVDQLQELEHELLSDSTRGGGESPVPGPDFGTD